MSEQVRTETEDSLDIVLARKRIGYAPGRGGGGGSDDMERRVVALEEDLKDIRTTLKELRDGQQASALAATQQSGDINTKLAEIGGRLSTISTFCEGVRRDTDRLPTKYDVTVIMIAVIGGLGATALLIKNVWPLLSKLFAG